MERKTRQVMKRREMAMAAEMEEMAMAAEMEEMEEETMVVAAMVEMKDNNNLS
ncbi:MAG TPA: hypothetical protein VE573_17145 [Nitrososphaeraceae archaeon]|jgi:hypothetical protein|nr:hypothetical protein [Nitrososphaeraceae archaeon]